MGSVINEVSDIEKEFLDLIGVDEQNGYYIDSRDGKPITYSESYNFMQASYDIAHCDVYCNNQIIVSNKQNIQFRVYDQQLTCGTTIVVNGDLGHTIYDIYCDSRDGNSEIKVSVTPYNMIGYPISSDILKVEASLDDNFNMTILNSYGEIAIINSTGEIRFIWYEDSGEEKKESYPLSYENYETVLNRLMSVIGKAMGKHFFDYIFPLLLHIPKELFKRKRTAIIAKCEDLVANEEEDKDIVLRKRDLPEDQKYQLLAQCDNNINKVRDIEGEMLEKYEDAVQTFKCIISPNPQAQLKKHPDEASGQ